jgi:dUTP pyrophosphatase
MKPIAHFKESEMKEWKEINIKLLSDTAKMPVWGSEYAAGADLYADNSDIVDIAPHSTVKISTGIAIELPENTFGAIFARSGLATKKGLRPANCTGVVDEDYRGAIIVALHNDTDEMMSVEPGERIAQLVVIPYVPVIFTIVDKLGETERGSNGFGSSGSK